MLTEAKVLDVTRDEVAGFCETPEMVPLEEQHLLSTAEPPLHPNPYSFLSIFMSQNSICQPVEAKRSTVR